MDLTALSRLLLFFVFISFVAGFMMLWLYRIWRYPEKAVSVFIGVFGDLVGSHLSDLGDFLRYQMQVQR